MIDMDPKPAVEALRPMPQPEQVMPLSRAAYLATLPETHRQVMAAALQPQLTIEERVTRLEIRLSLLWNSHFSN
jgi:hypothetical protein